MYDITGPRISIVSPRHKLGVERERELGQRRAWGEAEFFARCLGYRINIAEWDGQCFRLDRGLLPEDYQ